MKKNRTRMAIQILAGSAIACGAWWAATSYYGIATTLGNYVVMMLFGAMLALLLRTFNILR
jgi:glycopeptide antibiotics resistance protein